MLLVSLATLSSLGFKLGSLYYTRLQSCTMRRVKNLPGSASEYFLVTLQTCPFWNEHTERTSLSTKVGTELACRTGG